MMLFFGGGRDHGEAVSGPPDRRGAGSAARPDPQGHGVGADGPTSADAAAGGRGPDRRGDREGAPYRGVNGRAVPAAVRRGGVGGVAAGTFSAGSAPEAGSEAAGVRGGAGMHEAARGA